MYVNEIEIDLPSGFVRGFKNWNLPDAMVGTRTVATV
jgi:hypothetical protein